MENKKGKESDGDPGDGGGDSSFPTAEDDRIRKGKAVIDTPMSDLVSTKGKEENLGLSIPQGTLKIGENTCRLEDDSAGYVGSWTKVIRRGHKEGGSKSQPSKQNPPMYKVGSTKYQKAGEIPVVRRGAGASKLGMKMMPQQLAPSGSVQASKPIQPVPWRTNWAGNGGSVEDAGSSVPEFTPSTLNGICAADIQDEDVKDSALFWENTLVVYVIGGATFYGQLKRYIDYVWMPKREVEVITKANGYFFCKFADRKELERILSGGPWLFNGRFMILKEWTEEIELEQHVLSSMPVWIRLPNLPSVLWQRNSLGRIGSLIGKPIKMDLNTEKRRRLDYARLLIEISASGEAPKEVYVRMPSGKLYKQPIIYEYLPERCKGCVALGHTLINCPNKGIPCWRPVQQNVGEADNTFKTVGSGEQGNKEAGTNDNTQAVTEVLMVDTGDTMNAVMEDTQSKQREDPGKNAMEITSSEVGQGVEVAREESHPDNSSVEEQSKDSCTEVQMSEEVLQQTTCTDKEDANQAQVESNQNRDPRPSSGIGQLSLSIVEKDPATFAKLVQDNPIWKDKVEEAHREESVILNPEWKTYLEQLQREKRNATGSPSQKDLGKLPVRGNQRKSRKQHPYSN